MANNRYTYRRLFRNRLTRYQEQLKARNVNHIDQYGTPNMTYPNSSELRKLTLIKHIWKQGDRYYKLAHRYYGDKKLWWLIAWYNKAPTESHLRFGRKISIPMPLVSALSYMRERLD